MYNSTIASYIEKTASEIQEDEVTDVIKLSWVLPLVGGGALLAAGGAGGYYAGKHLENKANRQRMARMQQEALGRDITTGLIGAAAGYMARPLVSRMTQKAPQQYGNTSMSKDDMDYIYGKRGN